MRKLSKVIYENFQVSLDAPVQAETTCLVSRPSQFHFTIFIASDFFNFFQFL
jgi:hypothetical protein